MKRAHVLGSAFLWIAMTCSGCGGGKAPADSPLTATAGAGTEAAGMSGTPMASAGTAAGSGTVGASGSPSSMAGRSSPAASGTSGSTPGGGGGAGSTAASGAGGAGAAGGGMSGAGTGAGSDAISGAGGAAGASTPAEIPPPVTAPAVWGYAIGITDVAAATKFYTDVMKMTVVKDAVKRDDRTDTLLYSTQAMRGGRVMLMKFDDMRETRKITAKLVWQAQSATSVNRAASMYPDYESRLNIGIVQFDGPETYIQEVGGIFDTTAGANAITVPYPIALGFAVSDQPASRKFYTALGMTDSSLGTFSVTDATGTGSITEYTVKYETGPGVVLQQWSPMRNAKNNPVGVILMVPDAKAMGEKVMAAGGTIVKPAERSAFYDNRLLVVAKDLDGYILEIVE
ncbi:MAG TPA: VOC family protein [Polyangiales bacterium]|nr:VOC family protein [Polyangiales bacterium]